MPFYDHNLKIGRMLITDDSGNPEEIGIARLGTTPYFPDSVGDPIIDSFALAGGITTVANTGTSVEVQIDGSDGAEWSLSTDYGTLSASTGTIGTDPNPTWTLPHTESSSIETRSITVSSRDTTTLDEDLTTTISVQQNAGLASSVNMGIIPGGNIDTSQFHNFSWSYTGAPGATGTLTINSDFGEVAQGIRCFGNVNGASFNIPSTGAGSSVTFNVGTGNVGGADATRVTVNNAGGSDPVTVSIQVNFPAQGGYVEATNTPPAFSWGP